NLDGKCIDPDTAATTCVKPAPTSSATKPCASNADCASGEFCDSIAQSACLGPGQCTSRSNCGSGGGETCGCDGVTYPNIQPSGRVGVRRASAAVGCGASSNEGQAGSARGPRADIIFCGTSSQCPDGQPCCAITGQCYDPATPVLCTPAPPGTRIPCI